MATASQETSLDIEAQSSFVTTINETNPCITTVSVVTWGRFTASDCLPICLNAHEFQMQRLPPAKSALNLGKEILTLTFQAILALFFSSSSSPPPLSTALLQAAMMISFAVTLNGLFLRNAYPRIAVLFEKIGALFVASGVCIIASLLIHQKFGWFCWLPCVLSVLAFIKSFG